LMLRQKAAKTDTELAAEKKRVAEAEQRVADAEQARSELETTGAAAVAATKLLKEQLTKAEANAAQTQKAQLTLKAEQEELNAQLEKTESELSMLRQKAAKTDTELAAEKKRAAEAERRRGASWKPPEPPRSRRPSN
jgi:chromosome segregation ATPase